MKMRTKLEIDALGEDDIVILQVGSIIESKGVSGLIAAFEMFLDSLPQSAELRNRSWFLVLVGPQSWTGDLNPLSEMTRINDKLNSPGRSSRIIYRGPTPGVADYYGAADIYVMNSVCENFGVVLIEAMFAGLPGISRNCGGSPDMIVNGSTGFLLPAYERPGGGVTDLATIFHHMTVGPTWKKRLVAMGAAAYQRAREKFSYARMAREVSNVMGELELASEKWRCSANIMTKSRGRKNQAQHVSHGTASPPIPQIPASRILDVGCSVVGENVYLFGGYQEQDHVTKGMNAYNYKANTWIGAPAMPDLAAESHFGITSDTRYIYVISGQVGTQCQPPVKSSYAFDTHEQIWRKLPDLPVARYAGCAAILNDRLHFAGGMDADRRTPMVHHYSLALNELHEFWLAEGASPNWRSEPGLPYGSGHVLCRVVPTSEGDKLFYMGGESEDFHPKNSDERDFHCVPGFEYNNPFVFVFDGAVWKRGADLPYPISHTEMSQFVPNDAASFLNDGILMIGGTGAHETYVAGELPILTDGVLWYSSTTQTTTRIGSLYQIGMARKAACGVGWIESNFRGEQVFKFTLLGGQPSDSSSVPWPSGVIDKYAATCEGKVDDLFN